MTTMDNNLRHRLIRHLEQSIRTYDALLQSTSPLLPEQLEAARDDARWIIALLKSGENP